MNVVYNKSCESMAELPDGAVQTCVTSPPYFGLRDYGVEGQIGLEDTIDAYVQRLVGVFREVRRALRDDGTLWLNLGDSYASQGGPQVVNTINERAGGSDTQNGGLSRNVPSDLKPKDLMGVPWRVAFALQADGWWLRDAIVWAKPNPMPSSVTDRCTSSYEMVFMLAKSARYYADMESVKETAIHAGETRTTTKKSSAGQAAGIGIKPSGNAIPGSVVEITDRNPRNVWTIATTPYSDAHFATFPLELPLRCIRIGTKPGDLVLDPFAGSGTTLEAAESIGRRWVGYELNAAYVALIAERTRQIGLLA
jgi:DNA modification methylase